MRSLIITDRGYTLIEIVVGLALLSAVAVPLALFLADAVTKTVSDAVIDASVIASNSMEELILTRRFENSSVMLEVSGRKYQIINVFRRMGSLVEATIVVEKKEGEKELFRLNRYFYVPADKSK